MAILVITYDTTTGGFRTQKIGSAQISDGAIVSGKIGVLAVGTPHIAANAITSGKVASGGLSPLTSGKIWAGFTGNFPREEDKPAAGAPGPTIVRKTADKTLNNVAVLENDNHLLMAIGANEVWQIDIFLLHTGAIDADIKVGFAYPVDCVIFWGLIGAGSTTLANTWGYGPVASQDWILEQTESVATGMRAEGKTNAHRYTLIVINGANAGNLNLQWAQNTAQVSDTKVLENSCLIAHQLA